MKTLPVYRLEISTNDNEEVEVNYVALVDEPAIESNFIAFDSKKQYFADREKRMIMGPLMVPNMKIFRRDNEWGEYYVVFTAETIEQAVMKFARKGYQSNVNIMHSPNAKTSGVYMFESWIVNRQMGKGAPKEFDDLPDGTWFATFKIDNAEIWENFIKTGAVQGFSIEGIFEHLPVNMRTNLIDEVEKIIDSM